MKKQLIAGLLAAAVLGGISAIPAQAACRAATHCYGTVTKTSYTTRVSSPHRATVKRASVRRSAVHRAPVHTASTKRLARSSRVASVPARKRVHVAYGAAKPRSLKRSYSTSAALAVPASNASQGNVISLIKAMAPAQGVPTWFALRIARVESNYNSHMRGAAGEYGVFQMKCATAKGIGFSGNCAALLDPRTNIHWGLRHLALAIGASDGNLRLAASKHNGGLGRRTVVASYVNKVF
ncbi:transglycosylase SLT domain-containing protein [Aestuariivirga sp.]|uniref:transglycosylase SLT domain-containing protein n=1 Tax=Aestuariivirga sp. TaxID=2650926 RepID=UPI003BAB7303